jgi:hypothetical protein
MQHNVRNDTYNKLFAITISKNYSKELSLSIKNNLIFFDKWIIVTQEDDQETIDLIKKTNNKKIEIVYFPLVPSCSRVDDFKPKLESDDQKFSYPKYASKSEITRLKKLKNAVFEKGGALRYVQKKILPSLNINKDDLVALIDSDIILPEDFKNHLNQVKFKKNCLYGVDRKDFLFYSDYLNDKNYRPFNQMKNAGFLQIYKYDSTKLCKRTIDCEWVDREFQLQFSETLNIPCVATHLGLQGMNWLGKQDTSFIFDDSLERLKKVAKHQNISSKGTQTQIKNKLLKKMTANQLKNLKWNKAFPEFICIGFPNTNSHALRELLSKHFSVKFGMTKYGNINYFNHLDRELNCFGKTHDWYLNHFQRDGYVWGDYCESIFEFPNADGINKLHETFLLKKQGNPDVKFIVVVRDQVSRCIDQYNNYYHNFPSSLNWGWLNPGESLEKNITSEINALNKIGGVEKALNENINIGGNFLLNGCYQYTLNLLKNKLNLSDKTLMIVSYEELKRNTNITINKVCEFLNIKSVKKSNLNLNEKVVNSQIKYKASELIREFYIKAKMDFTDN